MTKNLLLLFFLFSQALAFNLNIGIKYNANNTYVKTEIRSYYFEKFKNSKFYLAFSLSYTFNDDYKYGMGIYAYILKKEENYYNSLIGLKIEDKINDDGKMKMLIGPFLTFRENKIEYTISLPYDLKEEELNFEMSLGKNF